MPEQLPNARLAAANPDLGEQHDVGAIHAALTREQPEPHEGFEPVNLWLVVLTGALLFWGGSYVTQYSGGFRADEFDERQINLAPPPSAGGGGAEDPKAAVLKLGAQIYNNSCTPCHQAGGEGVSGQFPPLAKSDWVLVEGPNRLIRIVLSGLNGPITVNGNQYNNAMNGWRDILSDAEIAAVLSYVRNSWGNKAGLVTPEEVKAIRDATAARTEPWTAAALLEIPDSGGAAPVPVAAPAGDLTPDQLRELLKKLPADQLKPLLQELAK
jgi:mono/diheme cytochrome c family protein